MDCLSMKGFDVWFFLSFEFSSGYVSLTLEEGPL